MMKILKRIGIALILLLALLAIVGLFLPEHITIERKLEVNTAAHLPYGIVNNITKWKMWSPWYKKDTTAQYGFSDTTSGTGAKLSWKSNNREVGEGSVTITDTKPNEAVYTLLQLGDWTPNVWNFIFEAQENKTIVSMRMDMHFGYNVMARWFGLMMDEMIGKDFEQALQNIKQVCESGAAETKVAGFVLNEKTTYPTTFIYLAYDNVKNQEIGLKIGEGLMKLDAFVKKHKHQVTGYPFTIWLSPQHFLCAIPVADSVQVEDEIQLGKLPEGKNLVLNYTGNYNNMAGAYKAMEQYIVEQKIILTGPAREVYVTDPMLEKDTTKWLTEMVFPIK